MSVGAAACATVVLAGLAVLQVLVAAGRPLGRLVWGGQHEVLPRGLRVGSALSVLLYAAIASVLHARAADVDSVATGLAVTTWVVFGFFTLGVLANGISRSRPERLVMTPVCLVLAACALVVATG